jgi:hypothetical protein
MYEWGSARTGSGKISQVNGGRTSLLVDYEIWVEISRNEPKGPEGGEIEFLNYWSERTYTDTYPSSSRNKPSGYLVRPRYCTL